MAGEVERVWQLGATLGEGPLWRADQGALWFVDIKRHLVHRFDPEARTQRTWHAPDQVGWIVPAAGGRWLVGLRHGLAWFDPDSGNFTRWLDPEPDQPGNRLNDACVDPHGRLWFGTMDDAEKADTGRLYRLGADGTAIAAGPACRIPNGPAASPDGRWLYHVDTMARRIWRFAIGSDGDLSDGNVIVEVADGDGHPDGASIDSEGCIWVGLYGGWAARRYSPAGDLLDDIRLPVANVTKVALGGPDLRTAYITTASKNLDLDDLGRQPFAGAVFAARVDVPGLPANEVTIGLPPR